MIEAGLMDATIEQMVTYVELDEFHSSEHDAARDAERYCIRQVGLDNLMNSCHGGAGRTPNDTVSEVYFCWSVSSMQPENECHSVSRVSLHLTHNSSTHLLDLTRGGQYKAQCIGDTIEEAAAAAAADPCRQFDIPYTPSHSHPPLR